MILKLFGHRSYTYLNSLCDNSEEETPYDNLAHVLEAVGDAIQQFLKLRSSLVHHRCRQRREEVVGHGVRPRYSQVHL